MNVERERNGAGELANQIRKAGGNVPAELRFQAELVKAVAAVVRGIGHVFRSLPKK